MGRIDDRATWDAISREVASIGDDAAREWFDAYGWLLAEYSRGHVKLIAEGMQEGPDIARAAVFARLEPEEAQVLFRAWCLDTIDDLQGIARRRAQLLYAFRELASELLPAVGQAVLRGLR